MKIDNTIFPERAAFALRLFVGVAFGLAMALLIHGDLIRNIHPSSWKTIVESTLALTAFVWWAGAGTLRRLSLVAWGLVATVVVALLAWYQTTQNPQASLYVFTAPVAWLILPLMFVAHELFSSGDRTARLIAPYPTYFDQAWKHGVQLGLSLLFTGLFWAILWLGAALLGFIGFHWFKDLLLKDWFALPASGAAMACAVQLGDVQDKLLTNVRALVLSVLSWLLPVIAVIGLLFLGSLCVSGLAPLWKTRAATVTLLSACIIFILLINAAYQQGDEERPVNIIMKWAARVACGLLLIFAGLATDSLWLRVDQYGLTSERVLAGAGVIIALLFGLGYATAAVWPGRWLHHFESVNIAMAFLEVVIFLGLLTPVADPARLSVDDQVARLQSGRTAPAHFDWHMLRFETGRYGTKALTILGNTGQTKDIRVGAIAAATLKDNECCIVRSERWVAQDNSATTSKPDDMHQLKVISPSSAPLPATFDGAALDSGGLRDCVRDPAKACTAALVDLDTDGTPEIVVLNGNTVTVFRNGAKGWLPVPMSVQYLDDDGVKAFNAGQIATKPHAWSDLTVGGTRTFTVN